MICGETNGVPYLQNTKKVKDDFGLRKFLPTDVVVIFNSIHTWMSRFEIKLKRKFWPENNRWVVSVWNKGKPRDGLFLPNPSKLLN